MIEKIYQLVQSAGYFEKEFEAMLKQQEYERAHPPLFPKSKDASTAKYYADFARRIAQGWQDLANEIEK